MASKTIVNNSAGSISYNGATIIPAPTPSGAGETIYGNSSGTGYISQAVSPTFKNRIINGDMAIDQRASATTQVTLNSSTTGAYSVDRWLGGNIGTGVYTMGKSSTAPTGFTSSLAVTCTTADTTIAAGDLYVALQRIEGNNLNDLSFGTASAKSITISFWVQTSLQGTYCIGLSNTDSSRTYVEEYTIASGEVNTWVKKTITVSGDTSGTWTFSTGVGMSLRFTLAAGSTFQSTAGSWQSANYMATSNQVNWMSSNTSRTFYVTGVQLEAGSVATEFEKRPEHLELQLCRRYYSRYSNSTTDIYFGGGVIASTSVAYCYIKYPQRLRASPTVSFSSLELNSNGTVSNVSSFSVVNAGSDSAMIGIVPATVWAAGLVGKAVSFGNKYLTSGYIEFSAEL